MKLYLVRHGEAVNPEIHPQRPLSEKGRNNVQRLANFLTPLGSIASHVYHSGKLRAKQTAEILAAAVAPGQDMEIMSGLDSPDIEEILNEVSNWVDDSLIVGHIPLLPRLVGKLVAGNENLYIVDFQPATMVCLQRISLDYWCISWTLSTEILPKSFNSI